MAKLAKTQSVGLPLVGSRWKNASDDVVEVITIDCTSLGVPRVHYRYVKSADHHPTDPFMKFTFSRHLGDFYKHLKPVGPDLTGGSILCS